MHAYAIGMGVNRDNATACDFARALVLAGECYRIEESLEYDSRAWRQLLS